jgi:predicted Na+-dependent transporter
MTIDKVFFGYMALAGTLIGTILVAAPRVQEFFIKPYFWVLIAVILFDGGAYLYRRNAPEAMLSMQAKLLGFVIGVVLMVVMPTLAGSPARFF